MHRLWLVAAAVIKLSHIEILSSLKMSQINFGLTNEWYAVMYMYIVMVSLMVYIDKSRMLNIDVTYNKYLCFSLNSSIVHPVTSIITITHIIRLNK